MFRSPFTNFACLIILVILGIAELSPFSPNEANAEEPKMNVLFILADDLGWRDLSNEGSTFYESPHIDRIAHEGMKFTRGYATCQVCSPSRASIMTGKYPARLKITEWIGAAMGENWRGNTELYPATYLKALPHQETTIAEAFKEGGYKTFFAGKWHLGDKGSEPEDHGFVDNAGGFERGMPPGGYFSPYKNPKLNDGPKGEYLPLRLGNETADWIEANQKEPFFAFLSFYAVHAPLQTTEKLWKKYRDKASKLPTPDQRFILDGRSPIRQVQDNPLYAGLIESMDDGVGIVLDRLDRLGLLENTIVVFTSDNGGVSAGDDKGTSNLPLRGGKGRQWEGGIREPFYIRWPGGRSGKTDVPAIGTDFYPTLLEMCNLPPRNDQHIDGRSLVPLMQKEGADARPEELSKLKNRRLFWHYPHYSNQGGDPSSMVREGDWKLIWYHEDERMELYNIAKDPSEQTSVTSDHPEITTKLRTELDNWLAETEATMPTQNPNFDPEKFEKNKQRIREKLLPKFEKQHGSLLEPDYQPAKGWWEETGQ